ncbi:MAG: acetoacetate--CoA ligase [Halieaceae bacterium]
MSEPLLPLWTPSAPRASGAAINRFREQVEATHGINIPDYPSLHRWSIEHPDQFWPMVWRFCGVTASATSDTVVLHQNRMPGAVWFPDARLNFAENLLQRRDQGVALIGLLEDGSRREISFADLHLQVAKLAAALRQQGVGVGDRVAGLMPNIPETVIAMLATASLGAIWTSCSPDFGFQGVMDRFGQAAPKVLFVTDGYLYNQKQHQVLPRVESLLSSLPSLEQVVVVPLLESQPSLGSLPRTALFADYIGRHSDTTTLEFEQLPFDHPLYIMYSSGTTGVPKCIVHGAGGTLLQHLKEHQLHCDLGRDDVFFYFTTCGWMMWNWLVSGLASGATLVLYDGSPFADQGRLLLDAIDREKITIFGTSAKFISALEKADSKPRLSHDLSSLRTILSTGSPLAHESFNYVYREFKADVCLSSIAGGTDIISCFVGGCPTLPVYAGQIQCKGLGMAVEFWGDDGESLERGKGELVCTKPFPSMPIGFWGDPTGTKYQQAYFDRFDNVWCHGDYGEITAEGGVIIHGRSDAVLNPGGVRIGTAEIYRQVEKIDAVVESIVIGQEWRDDVRVVLFVVLRDGLTLTPELAEQIRETIRRNTTNRHVPAVILQVADIPRTLSGKIVELAVRNVIHGIEVKNTDALANPEALELYRDLPALAN